MVFSHLYILHVLFDIAECHDKTLSVYSVCLIFFEQGTQNLLGQ